MLFSEQLSGFYGGLQSRTASKADCIAAVDWCVAEDRYLEALYILDVALSIYSASLYLHQRAAEIIDGANIDAAIDRFLDQSTEYNPDIVAIYRRIWEKLTPLHGPGSPRGGSESFLRSVVFKIMCMLLDKDQPVRHVFLRLSEHFGRLSAGEHFGQPVTSAVVKAGIAKIRIGDRTLRYHVSNSLVDFRLRYFFLNEPGLLRLISQFRDGDVFLDIGANIGCFSIAAAVTKSCRTYAVEPFSANYSELLRNISLNAVRDRVTPLALAISDRTGEGPLSFSSDHAGAASQAFDDGRENAASESNGVETVQGYRLDDLVAEGKIEFPTHIKIDVDGTEHRIIAGMPEALTDRRLRSIRLEIHTGNPANSEALRKIEAAGFSWQIDDDPKNLLCLRS
ncbi:hypothetical protein GCM10017083_50010 [Thalassobaculum fulvum]|uniref:Methyltransferase FkbM domain-containing protein n=1 Tax=Thalassobaculum fulvum TaxID=1633335 RepID=A0A918XX63_9PROT|nr:FkbM family methyltransferase [Thalassobaculum fulvum]GHD61940.1 hypothetical protein GCM10017083_50010 [Thalassobaculum fulvum]